MSLAEIVLRRTPRRWYRVLDLYQDLREDGTVPWYRRWFTTLAAVHQAVRELERGGTVQARLRAPTYGEAALRGPRYVTEVRRL